MKHGLGGTPVSYLSSDKSQGYQVHSLVLLRGRHVNPLTSTNDQY